MADIRIKDLTTTASTTAADDFFAADGATNGTRKLSAYSPTFGGNATVGGTLTVTGATSVAANLKSSVSSSGSTGGILLAENTAAAATGNQASVFFPTSTGASTYWQLIGRQNSATANDQTLRVVFGGVAQHTYFNASDLSVQSGITLKVLDTTASTSTSSGALVVGNGTSGGLGVGGAIWAGGGASIAGTPTLPAAWTGGYGIGLDGALTNRRIFFGDGSGYDIRFSTRISSTTTDRMTLTDTGNLTVGGALTVSGTTTADGLATSGFFGGSKRVIVGYNTSSDYGFIASVDTGIGWKELHLNPVGGVVKVPNTAASTSTSSGALVVSGGVGVAGRMHVNGVTTGGDNETHVTFVRNGTVSIGPDSTGTPALVVSTAIKTSAPSGGTAANWKLGTVATVSPTSPNRTIEVDIGGTIYYIHAKTTNN
jgi:hypothetical protein